MMHCVSWTNWNAGDHPAEIEFELNSVQLSQISRKEENLGKSSTFKIPGAPPPTVQQNKSNSAQPYLNGGAVYHQTREGKVKLNFKLKKQQHNIECKAEPEKVKEYTQVWDRSVLVDRRCFGKGSTKDKVTLRKASGLVFCDKAGGEEEEAMELREIGNRIEIAAHRYRNNSEYFEQMFNTETLFAYNTTPDSYAAKNLKPRFSNTLIINPNHLIAAKYNELSTSQIQRVQHHQERKYLSQG